VDAAVRAPSAVQGAGDGVRAQETERGAGDGQPSTLRERWVTAVQPDGHAEDFPVLFVDADLTVEHLDAEVGGEDVPSGGGVGKRPDKEFVVGEDVGEHRGDGRPVRRRS